MLLTELNLCVSVTVSLEYLSSNEFTLPLGVKREAVGEILL
jgi:hypothetical protein